MVSTKETFPNWTFWLIKIVSKDKLILIIVIINQRNKLDILNFW
jgi:hypothetical protein